MVGPAPDFENEDAVIYLEDFRASSGASTPVEPILPPEEDEGVETNADPLIASIASTLDYLSGEAMSLRVDIDTAIADEIRNLQQRVAVLEDEARKDVIVLRTVTREEAEREIVELFQTKEVLYYSDISERLRIDLPIVVEICNDLIERGEIEIDGDTA